MLKQFVFWGSAGHAKVLADLVCGQGCQILALFDNDPRVSSCLSGVPIYHGDNGFYHWLGQQTDLSNLAAAIAIGGAYGKDRHNLAQMFSAVGLYLPTLIHSRASFAKTVVCGKGCQILSNAVVAADVTLGDVCIINNSANVDHECKIGHGVHIAPGATLCGCITVGNYTMIGAGAVILPRITIGENVLVGAGAIVTKDVPDGAVMIGNPAKILKINI